MQGSDHEAPIIGDVRTAPHAAPWRRPALLGAAAVGLLVIGVLAWRSRAPTVREPAAPVAAAPAVPAASSPAAPLAAASEPVYPVAPPASAAPLPALDESDIEIARLLEPLVGREGLAQLRTAGFIRHLVATVDNLGRSHAAAHAWPVNTTPGRFTADSSSGTAVISPDNDLRYASLVLLAESVDMAAVGALYRRTYPLMQQAYEELGFPGRHFNDRLVAVIDSLLAAPEPQGPVAVEPVVVEGGTPLARPWQHHVFADPALEALPSGQKIMVRVGLVNERRLKERLRLLRAELTRDAAAR
jgi:hypothetical protein